LNKAKEAGRKAASRLGVLLCLLFPVPAIAFELIAHRGVHQEYSRENLTDETCTASRVTKGNHAYLENTIDSMKKAFELGATMVELDIHPTNESDPAKDTLVVIHDWTLDCRTEATCASGCKCENGHCTTHLQSLAFMKSLDAGYGYTFDEGKTYPFRGKYKGKIPTLEEALDLLKRFPGKKLLINWKDRFPKTVDIFLKILSRYPPEIRSRVYFEYYGLEKRRFTDLGIPEAIYQRGGSVTPCMKKYLLWGWAGSFPKECSDTQFFVPLNQSLGFFVKILSPLEVTDILWGWPKSFLEKAHQHGTKIYASQVDSEEDLLKVIDLPIDGIMTNRIEIIAPLMRKHARLR
jgi:glycerophosphoryl diester phosphodiesterase